MTIDDRFWAWKGVAVRAYSSYCISMRYEGNIQAADLFGLAGAPRSPLDLLTHDITYPGWERQVGIKPAFYVTGLRWFQDNVLRNKLNVTGTGYYITAMTELLKTRPEWTTSQFPWDEMFSVRQFVDTASPLRRFTPRFDKAVQVILLCEVITQDLHSRYPQECPRPEAIYAHMRIHPAIFFIHGFDRTFHRVVERYPVALMDLREETGQRSNQVFYDMAQGKTVTLTLVEATREFFTRRFPADPLGDVDYRLFGRVRFSPSKSETLDLG